MPLDIELLHRLRDATGAGIFECRKAVEACLGHEDLAVRWLRSAGVAVAYRDAALHPQRQLEAAAKQRGPKR